MLKELMTGINEYQIKKLNAFLNEDLVKKNKYDKFGNGEYISIDTFRRIMNDIFGFTWSWEIIETIEKWDEGFVAVKGRLTVPGIGVKEGFGSAKIDKKDNSSVFSSAASYAFKSCCRMIGISASILDEDFDLDLYEDEIELNRPEITDDKKKQKQKLKEEVEDDEPEEKDEEPEEKPSKPKKGKKKEEDEEEEAPRRKKKKDEPEEELEDEEDEPEEKPSKKNAWSAAQKKKVAQLKKAYKIDTTDQMVAFAQIWNPKIKEAKDLTPDLFEELYDYVEENTEEFEDFDPSEVE